ncbi:MAG: hypothetical protein J0M20_08860 [Burkholderiales bacterium]|nr:hypothetical protein [Burkholderiales bacterium]
MVHPGELGGWRAVGLAAALSSLPVWAWSAPVNNAQTALTLEMKDAQSQVEQALAHRQRLLASKASDCLVALDSDAVLAKADPSSPTLAQLVQQSLDAQARCDKSTSEAAAAEAALANARQTLRTVAQQLVAAASSSPGTSVSTAPGPQAKVFVRAAEMDDQVVKLQAAADAAKATGNTAIDAALKVRIAPKASPVLTQRYDTWTTDARTLPQRLKTEEAPALQAAADSTRRLALEAHKSCLGKTGEACQTTPAYAAAEASLKDYDTALAASTKTKDSLDTARFGLEALARIAPDKQEDPQIKWDKRLARDIEFRRLLNTDPDIKSFFAGDALGFSAAKVGTDATLRYTMNWGWDTLVNRLTVLGTVPASAATTSTPLRSTDGLAGKAVLGLAYQRTSPGFLSEFPNLIYDVSVGAKVARAPLSYLLADANGVYGEVHQSFVDPEAFVSVAGLFFSDDRPDHMMTLTYREQRVHGYKNASDGVKLRCLDDPQRPSGKPLDCITAGLGAPTLLPNRLLSLDMRFDFGKFALAPRLTRSFTARSTAVDLPLYFIRNKADKTSTGFTGGVSLGWDSARAGINWGLFVSTPLSFSPSKPE